MKGIFWKEGESFTNSMSLIVSLLVRYPGIATINFDPAQKSLGFTFAVARPMSQEDFQGFATTVQGEPGSRGRIVRTGPRSLGDRSLGS